MPLSENALNILKRRYLQRDEDNKLIESPEEMFQRVAKTVASSDKLYNNNTDLQRTETEFFEMMYNLEFLPNSPTLMNAGRPLGQLSACFVIPIADSMEGIFEALKSSALIHKSGGGTGFSFSNLRPKGSSVKSTGGIASGPVSFMKLFNLSTEIIKQGGKRRGANMGILKINHPDILEFITCKFNNKELENFNISVGLTEDFFRAVDADLDYDLISPHSNLVVKRLSATKVFNLIAETAWKSGDPGIVFIDRINEENPTPELSKIESTNPCGEQPLLPFESCNLGSINLSLMTKENNSTHGIDYDKLKNIIYEAVHFLDNVIDINKYPLPEIHEITLKTRKIGLGVMGFADMLCKLGIPYNSDEAVTIAEKVMDYIHTQSKMASAELAKNRGSFPAFDKSIYKQKGIEYRNATTTTIAPTGTLSIIAGTSSGIEPLYALSYIRKAAEQEFIEVNPLFKAWVTEAGFHSNSFIQKISNAGSIQDIGEIPEEIRRIFVTAYDIGPEWHVKIQAAFQKYTDNAVSKTVNLRNEATIDQVKEVFKLAYKHKLKGITIYRDESKDEQVLNIGEHLYKNHSTLIESLPNNSLCIDCEHDKM